MTIRENANLLFKIVIFLLLLSLIFGLQELRVTETIVNNITQNISNTEIIREDYDDFYLVNKTLDLQNQINNLTEKLNSLKYLEERVRNLEKKNKEPEEEEKEQEIGGLATIW